MSCCVFLLQPRRPTPTGVPIRKLPGTPLRGIVFAVVDYTIADRFPCHRLGGTQTIVQTHLGTVMAGLSSAQLDVAAAVFQYLIMKSGTKTALTAEALADWAERPIDAVQELLETLCSGPLRILRAVAPR